MSNDGAISIRGLSKAFTIARNHERHSTLAETLLSRLKKPWSLTRREKFWALRDVNLEIAQGEVVGIIGRNGAGKSTLLKVLSRITQPTCGEIDLFGRVGSLLEVGTGFHPELTGRENIFLNGAILGMSKAEIRKEFDAIVDFAGVERFLDTPVKRYSSGMYVRLAFAVAAHLQSEILIVDEVLSVGDASFQQKCLGKMGDVARGGRTVLFVSHNMAAVSALCGRAVLLDHGRAVAMGPPSDVIEQYMNSSSWSGSDEDGGVAKRPRWAKPLIMGARLINGRGARPASYAVGQPIRIGVSYQLNPELGMRRLNLGLVIKTRRGISVGTINMKMTGDVADVPIDGAGEIICTLEAPPLTPGTYSVDLWLGDGLMDSDMIEGALRFNVEPSDFYGTGVSPVPEHGPMVLQASWTLSSDIHAMREHIDQTARERKEEARLSDDNQRDHLHT